MNDTERGDFRAGKQTKVARYDGKDKDGYVCARRGPPGPLTLTRRMACAIGKPTMSMTG
jgi:hypothetical protein